MENGALIAFGVVAFVALVVVMKTAVVVPQQSAFVVELEAQTDARGSFARTFCAREFRNKGLVEDFVQCNMSWNARRGTVRGMHYQLAPWTDHVEVYWHPEFQMYVAGVAAGEVMVAVGLYARFLRPSPSRVQWSLGPTRCAVAFRF
jgi:hypothetical protein